MIIKLKGADFSANNINSLLNSWPITFYGRTLVTGTFTSSISKGETYTATFSVADQCTVDSVSITRGGTTMSGATISDGTISISVPTTTESGPISITFNGSKENGDDPVIPDVPVNPDTPTTLTLHKSATGNSILDYKDVWKMFGASSLATKGSQIIGVDVSAYAGQTISITAGQSVIADANYAMFCSNLPNAYIKSLNELDGYNSFGTATEYTPESYDNLIESFNISTVSETTNTVAKVVPTNAKYLFFSNLNTVCAEPSVVSGQATGASLPTYVTDYGWGAMDYQTYFYLTGNSTYKSYNSKVVAADVSQLVGQTLSITATQSIVDGASFSFFTNALPSGISTINDIHGLDYSDTTKYNFNDSDLVEGFNVSTTHQVQNTIEKVVPAGAKYLFVNTLDKYGSCDIKSV